MIARDDVGLRSNDPCFITEDLHEMMTFPAQWVLVRHVIEWLMAVPNSHRRQAFIELQYKSREGDAPFPYVEIEHFPLTNWNIAWCDFTTYGAQNQNVKVIAMIVPTDQFYSYVRSGGMSVMSRMSVADTAIRQKLAAVHTGELYPTDALLVKHQIQQTCTEVHLPKNEPIRVLDICAGPGVYGMYAKHLLEASGLTVELHGIEINEAFEAPPEFDYWHVGDFREFESIGNFHIQLANPHFSGAGEVALFANRHRPPQGVFSMLIGANFPFSDNGGRGELFDTFPPSQIYYLLSRPGFYFPFAERAKIKERFNSSPRGTNANEHMVIVWDRRPPLPPTRVRWKYYNQDDPIHKRLQDRGSMVICALTFEAAKETAAAKREKREPVLFNDYFSFIAANRWKWDFFHASTEDRDRMRSQIIREKSMDVLGVKNA